jgi:hypothetical protein
MTKTAEKEVAAPPANFGPFQLAKNNQAYAKVAFFGSAGSGKTLSATLAAIGLYKRLKAAGKNPGPVVMVDTEAGSDYIVSLFEAEGIPFYVTKTRAFVDLMVALNAADGKASILIVDSVTHFWTELQSAYKKKTGRQRLEFRDWDPIKSQWGEFTLGFLNSRLHIFALGRAGFTYEHEEDEDGKKQLIKTGTKMKAEAEMGYEPSLVIEMVCEKRPGADPKKLNGQLLDHVAYIGKDRSRRLEGKRIVNPTYKDFEPFFDFLNIGGEHSGIEPKTDSTVLFDKNSDRNFYEKKRQIEIAKEEIEGLLVSGIPGQGAAEKKLRSDLFNEAFGTRSWTALDDKDPKFLKEGIEILKQKIHEANAAKEAK